MAGIQIAQGALAPESLDAIVTSDPTELNLTTVSSAYYCVRLPNGQLAMWVSDIISASPGLILLRHEFQSGDTELLGEYRFKAHLVVPSGLVRSEVDEFEVVDQFSI